MNIQELSNIKKFDLNSSSLIPAMKGNLVGVITATSLLGLKCIAYWNDQWLKIGDSGYFTNNSSKVTIIAVTRSTGNGDWGEAVHSLEVDGNTYSQCALTGMGKGNARDSSVMFWSGNLSQGRHSIRIVSNRRPYNYITFLGVFQ